MNNNMNNGGPQRGTMNFPRNSMPGYTNRLNGPNDATNHYRETSNDLSVTFNGDLKSARNNGPNPSMNIGNKDLIGSQNKMYGDNASMTSSCSLSAKTSTTGCTCKKSKCLKLYCQCFASSFLCNLEKCKCIACENKVGNEKEILAAKNLILERNPSAFEDKLKGTNRNADLNNNPILRSNWSFGVGARNPNLPSQNVGSNFPTNHNQPQFGRPWNNFNFGNQSYPPSHLSQPRNQHDPIWRDMQRSNSNGNMYSKTHPIQQYNSQNQSQNHHQFPQGAHQDRGIPRQLHDPTTIFRTISNSPAPNEKSTSSGGCKCKKTGCLKKYCDCFQRNVKCMDSCKCLNCKNQPEGDKDSKDKSVMESSLDVLKSAAQSISYNENITRFHGETFSEQAAMHQNLETRSKMDNFLQRPPSFRKHEIKYPSQYPLQEYRGSAGNKSSPGASSDSSKEIMTKLNEQFTNDQSRTRNMSLRGLDIMAALATTELEAMKRSSSSCDLPSRKVSPTPDNAMDLNRNYDNNFQSIDYSDEDSYKNETNTSLLVHGHDDFPPSKKARVSPNDEFRGISTLTKDFSGKSRSLPKFLSYRKICSKCGKTRSEHGELGFGNKCVYQECGKCGAGIEAHERANKFMGFSCSLTVEEGANFGLVERYEKKIKELALMAELKNDSQSHKSRKGLVRS